MYYKSTADLHHYILPLIITAEKRNIFRAHLLCIRCWRRGLWRSRNRRRSRRRRKQTSRSTTGRGVPHDPHMAGRPRVLHALRLPLRAHQNRRGRHNRARATRRCGNSPRPSFAWSAVTNCFWHLAELCGPKHFLVNINIEQHFIFTIFF